MIFIFELDFTVRDGKRWRWKPSWFTGFWESKRTWRLGWGVFSVSYYPSRSLRRFFDYVESENTAWYSDPDLVALSLRRSGYNSSDCPYRK